MPDDPNKKGRDRKLVSRQPHEQAYQKRKAAKSRTDNEDQAGRKRGEDRGMRRGGQDNENKRGR